MNMENYNIYIYIHTYTRRYVYNTQHTQHHNNNSTTWVLHNSYAINVSRDVVSALITLLTELSVLHS